jgi:hypothetical protein
MKVNEIKEIAKRHNLKVGKATKSELVQAIQHFEGNQQCFDSNLSAECEQHSCVWREDCV